MKWNVVVSYDSAKGFMVSRDEIARILERCGERDAKVELFAPGIIGVRSRKNAFLLVQEINELFLNDPESMSATVRWLPVSSVCELDVIPQCVREEVSDTLRAQDPYEFVFENYADAPAYLPERIRKIVRAKQQERADKVLYVLVFARFACISLVRKHGVFIRG